MASIPRPTLNRVPGMPVAKQEVLIKDLTKLTRIELVEIAEREGKLLANKAKLARLPDKGERIRVFYDKVQAELERRSNVDEAAELFSQLNIAAKGQKALNHLEWSGERLNEKQLAAVIAADPTEDVLDSDDETEMDPLRILAQRTMHERRIEVIPADPSLITVEDLAEIESFTTVSNSDSGLSSDAQGSKEASIEEPADTSTVDAEIVTMDVGERLPSLKAKLQQIITKPTAIAASSDGDSRSSTPASGAAELEPHVLYLVGKTETQTQPQREKFKPYKTTISDVHDPAKERGRKQGKHWEITAATPPPIQHVGTKMLTLLDSVEIQINYLEKLKELQEKQAAERLAARMERLGSSQIQLPDKAVLQMKPSFTVYRSQIEGQRDIPEDDEVHDPLDAEKPGGGITYSVYE